MIALAINILWLLIGVIVLCGVVYFALMAIKTFVPIDSRIERAIWLIVLILLLIGALTLLAGGNIGPVRGWKSSAVPQIGGVMPPAPSIIRC